MVSPSTDTMMSFSCRPALPATESAGTSLTKAPVMPWSPAALASSAVTSRVRTPILGRPPRSSMRAMSGKSCAASSTKTLTSRSRTASCAARVASSTTRRTSMLNWPFSRPAWSRASLTAALMSRDSAAESGTVSAPGACGAWPCTMGLATNTPAATIATVALLASQSRVCMRILLGANSIRFGYVRRKCRPEG